MNKKLEQLLEDEGMGEYDFYTKDDVIYFAKECIHRCADLVACNNHVSGFALHDLIEKHFGVEE